MQFDISCYNVCCNKCTQMMNYMRGKESSLEAIAANVIRKLRPLAKLFGKEMTEYSGGLGKELEDSMNAEAFAKDVKRYQVKIQHMKNQKVKLGARLRARNDGNLKTILDMNALIKKEIRPLRDEWLNAEREYHIAVKGKAQNIQELNMKRQEALGKWQEQRQGLALASDRALDKEDLSPDARQYLELVMHEEDLRDTFYEICDQFEFRDYRSPQGMKENMFTLSSALVAFGVELDADPHTACRSGKDRTSLQRMEIGTRFISREVYGRHLHYREREKMPETAKIREQMLLNSGQIDDLAALNTGSSGLNVAGSYGSYLKDFGNGGKVFAPWYENIVLQGSRYAFAMKLK